MATAKEQQRNELHKTIWSIADDLREQIDALVVDFEGGAEVRVQ